MPQRPSGVKLVSKLVDRFEMHRDAYLSGRYNETQLRREFIDPLWRALGWDIDNAQGYAEAYKDVIHEDAVKVSADSYTKAPDYCFRIGGVRKYFLEAKQPSVDIKDDPAPAFQLRRYAWSAKLPLSILTGFEELAVYDTRVKPASTDKASKARTLLIPYTEYVERWDEIASMFSRDAVLKGSFDKYAESSKAKRRTAAVDEAFLQEIESWRDELARNLALRNPTLSQRELNFAVQATIDRIVFLRITEDRGIEPYGQLLALTNGVNTYVRLFEVFRKADQRYNSGLFHFSRERRRAGEPDDLSRRLQIDDKPLKDILRSLYYPDSPYEFSVLSSDILGQVYEQFLGKVIRLTAGQRAVVEEKPEVKKAGGVYYTPTDIVDYIVRQTVGKLLDGKTPREVAGATRSSSPLRIVDPACGSGAFLLGAYQYLLDWHRDRYVDDGPAKHTKGKSPILYLAAGGDWRLTTGERKRILLTHIFGVDIDEKAVEVTKLSLLLKVLEGESDQTLEAQFRLFHERALPDLDGNVKVGNSLIGPEIYDRGEILLPNDNEQDRLRVFDWRREFSHIFGAPAGGFDVVVGNPPYIRIQALKEWYPAEVAYYKQGFASGSKGNFDIYVLFVERGLELLGRAGRLGMILPSKFLSTDYGRGLRMLISSRKALSKLVDFGHGQVFADATTYTCLLFLGRPETEDLEYVSTRPEELNSSKAAVRRISSGLLTAEPWLFGSAEVNALLQRLMVKSAALQNLPTDISRGSSTGADDVYCLTSHGRSLLSREGETVDVEADLLRVPIYASDFGRYRLNVNNGERVLFPYRVSEGGYTLIDEPDLKRDYPNAYEYLRSQRSTLENRKQFSRWYSFSAPRNLHTHQRAHFLVPLLADRGAFAPAPNQPDRYCLMASGGFSLHVHQPATGLNPLYVLALLNSRLLFWNLRLISNKFRGGWITCTKQYVGTLPIRLLPPSTRGSRAVHDTLVALAEQMLALQSRLAQAKVRQDKDAAAREIGATDRKIDLLVYALYELTDAEIALVESETPQ